MCCQSTSRPLEDKWPLEAERLLKKEEFLKTLLTSSIEAASLHFDRILFVLFWIQRGRPWRGNNKNCVIVQIPLDLTVYILYYWREHQCSILRPHNVPVSWLVINKWIFYYFMCPTLCWHWLTFGTLCNFTEIWNLPTKDSMSWPEAETDKLFLSRPYVHFKLCLFDVPQQNKMLQIVLFSKVPFIVT